MVRGEDERFVDRQPLGSGDAQLKEYSKDRSVRIQEEESQTLQEQSIGLQPTELLRSYGPLAVPCKGLLLGGQGGLEKAADRGQAADRRLVQIESLLPLEFQGQRHPGKRIDTEIGLQIGIQSNRTVRRQLAQGFHDRLRRFRRQQAAVGLGEAAVDGFPRGGGAARPIEQVRQQMALDLAQRGPRQGVEGDAEIRHALVLAEALRNACQAGAHRGVQLCHAPPAGRGHVRHDQGAQTPVPFQDRDLP